MRDIGVNTLKGSGRDSLIVDFDWEALRAIQSKHRRDFFEARVFHRKAIFAPQQLNKCRVERFCSRADDNLLGRDRHLTEIIEMGGDCFSQLENAFRVRFLQKRFVSAYEHAPHRARPEREREFLEARRIARKVGEIRFVFMRSTRTRLNRQRLILSMRGNCHIVFDVRDEKSFFFD